MTWVQGLKRLQNWPTELPSLERLMIKIHSVVLTKIIFVICFYLSCPLSLPHNQGYIELSQGTASHHV